MWWIFISDRFFCSGISIWFSFKGFLCYPWKSAFLSSLYLFLHNLHHICLLIPTNGASVGLLLFAVFLPPNNGYTFFLHHFLCSTFLFSEFITVTGRKVSSLQVTGNSSFSLIFTLNKSVIFKSHKTWVPIPFLLLVKLWNLEQVT